MSASNWATCPSCLLHAEADKAKREQRVVDMYGNVPMEEWDRIRREANVPVALQDTFREDYEFYLDGWNVKVVYSGRCSVCGSGVKFSDSRPIEMKDPPASSR